MPVSGSPLADGIHAWVWTHLAAGLLGQAPSVLGSGSHRTPLAAGIGLPDPFWLVPGATEWTPLLLALQMGT